MCDSIPGAGRQAVNVPAEVLTIYSSQESSTAIRLGMAVGEQGMGIFFVSVFCKLLYPAQNHSVAMEWYSSPRKSKPWLTMFECPGDTLVIWLNHRQTCEEQAGGSMIFMGPFQTKVFCDLNVNNWYTK